ncbi:acyl-CoA thioesterase [Desulfoluna spongiiphila]|uniref:Acyl-CoA hydrolase n=1 Tax=Desulfoluna spongiiphila TaxID=419481 RepID=A0A1G5GAA5_9BACT|nr:thioesterase family protein [Desulfoluna spongiiphila]SCY48546.1 acyl-CoA hydrolase [Desulfoluna spongiiphila]VVS93677.1 thioesterase-like superfamily [Desulfoluna spongiiphila]
MDIHALFDAATGDDTGVNLTIPDTWLQGRTAFGGLVAVVGLAAMRQQVGHDLPLRNLLIAFVGPTGTGGIRAEGTILRQGTSVTHAQAQVVTSQGDLCATLHGCFGADRPSRIRRQDHTAPAWTPPDELTELPFMEGLAPSFTQYFRYHWAEGPYPFEGRSEGAYGGWISFRGEKKETHEAHLLALMDAWPSPSLSMLNDIAPASTLTWHLEMCDTGRGFATTDEWRFKTRVDTAQHGYVGEEARLWAPDGKLAGISRQMVTVFG